MNPLLCLALAGATCGTDVPVSTPAEFAAALAAVGPGDRILLAPGTYAGDFYARRLDGTASAPITITAANPASPPVLQPVNTGLHLAGASYVVLDGLVVSGFADNGLNIDDDGDFDRPSHHIELRNLLVTGTSPGGNCDGIKLSGVDDARLLNCTVERWGAWGSGVDMVGCHRVLVGSCLFRLGGFNGVQVKGGSSQVRVAGCRFDTAGERAVQAGGSTEAAYFRPRLETVPAGQRSEARDILVEGNVNARSEAAVACCTADGVTVRLNTVYRPGKYFLRILQETTDPTFLPCRGGVVTDNLVVFRSASWWAGGVNVGVLTAPQTFGFARNAWYCEDAPGSSAPGLPTPEVEGVIGRDPRFNNPANDNFRPRDRGATAGKGYTAFRRDW